jgi:hypothetical protein
MLRTPNMVHIDDADTAHLHVIAGDPALVLILTAVDQGDLVIL